MIMNYQKLRDNQRKRRIIGNIVFWTTFTLVLFLTCAVFWYIAAGLVS